MKNLLVSFFNLIFCNLAIGQVSHTQFEYTLIKKNYNTLFYKKVFLDSIELCPELKNYEKIISINCEGFEQGFNFDIGINKKDTIGYFTAFTYEKNKSKISKNEKLLFPGYKIKRKNKLTLLTNQTTLPDSILLSILEVVQLVDFDSVPDNIIAGMELKHDQLDGYGYRITVKNSDRKFEFIWPIFQLKEHPKLQLLGSLDSFLLHFIFTNRESWVKYKPGCCYEYRLMICLNSK